MSLSPGWEYERLLGKQSLDQWTLDALNKVVVANNKYKCLIKIVRLD